MKANPHTTYVAPALTAGATQSGERHVLDRSRIDERDEIDDGQQLCLVWCETHRAFEWHWIEVED